MFLIPHVDVISHLLSYENNLGIQEEKNIKMTVILMFPPLLGFTDCIFLAFGCYSR